MTRLPMSESDLQALVVDALEALGFDTFHVRPGRTHHGWRVPTSGTLAAGFPDIFATNARRGRALFVELKAERGRLSPDQERVHAILRDSGFIVEIVRPSTVDDFIDRLAGIAPRMPDPEPDPPSALDELLDLSIPIPEPGAARRQRSGLDTGPLGAGRQPLRASPPWRRHPNGSD